MDRKERIPEDGGVASSQLPKTSSNLVNGDMIETVVVMIPESTASDGDTATALGCSKESISNVGRETKESSNVKNSSHGVNSETILVIDPDGDSAVKNEGLGGLSKESEKSDTKSKTAEAKNCAAMINVKQKGAKGLIEDRNIERVCRICYLASDQSSEAKTGSGTTTSELIQLGCGCKDELGIAHTHCAEAWFKLKGNRMCEICGETAENVEGIGDNRFMAEWNEGRSGDSGRNVSNRVRGCWRGQPLCNLLMACLVIAFVLPWFFRINIF